MPFYFNLICFLPSSSVNFPIVPKVAGGTEADLTIRARKTRLYVCRVNNQFGNVVFSDWVKVKVLDIDKTGTHHYFNAVSL